MCYYDVLVLQLFQQVCKFVDVHMSAGLGPAGMLVFVERTLGD